MSKGWIRQKAPVEGPPLAFEATVNGGNLTARIGERSIAVELGPGASTTGWCRSNGLLRSFAICRVGALVHVWVDGEAFVFELSTQAPRAAEKEKGESEVRARMPGRVLQLFVSAGERVEAGQRLLVIESMKIQFVVQASQAGRVQRIAVSLGDQVQAGDFLLEVAEEESLTA